MTIVHVTPEDIKKAEELCGEMAILLRRWMEVYGSHCGSCCRLDDAGKVITPDYACVCHPLVKDTRAALQQERGPTGPKEKP